MTGFPNAVRELPRVLSAEDATALVGHDVDPVEANITTATIAVDPERGEPVFAYLPLGPVAELRRAVLGIRYSVSGGQVRSTGLRNSSRTFGYGPRRPVYRREGCSPTSTSGDFPREHTVIANFSDRLADVLGQVNPELVTRGREAASPVLPEWRLGESKLWTSGVINQSARLPYHRDAFNLPAWSAMPVLRRHMDGGYLAIPEYGAVLACRDGWGVFFAGYELVHGVTPMSPRREDGYRYSVVYYALRGMKDCFTHAVETAYARRKRTEREQDIARRLAEGEPSLREQGRGLPGGHHGMRTIAGRQHMDDPRTAREVFDPATVPTGDPAAIEDVVLAEKDAAATRPRRKRKGNAGAARLLNKGGGTRLMGGRPVLDGKDPAG